MPRPTPCTGATPRTTLPPQPGVPSSAPGREPKTAAAASTASCSRAPRHRARRSYGDTATKRPRARTPQLVPQRRAWQRQGTGQGRGQERRWLGRRRSRWAELPGRPHQVAATLTATTAGVAAATLAATVAVVSGGAVAAFPAALPALLPASAAAAAAEAVAAEAAAIADPLRWIAHPAAVAVLGVRPVAARREAVMWPVAAARQVAPRQAPAPTCVTRLNSASLPRKGAVGMSRRATHAMPTTRTARP